MKFVVRTIVNALALWLCVVLLPGITLTGATQSPYLVLYYLAAGAILAAINFLVRPILVVLSIPLYIVTLGLFFLVVNAVVLLIASWLTGFLNVGIAVYGFGWALLGGIVIGLVNTIVDWFLPAKVRR